jgi:hypothetical protein
VATIDVTRHSEFRLPLPSLTFVLVVLLLPAPTSGESCYNVYITHFCRDPTSEGVIIGLTKRQKGGRKTDVRVLLLIQRRYPTQGVTTSPELTTEEVSESPLH